jgi:hypothetical protein
MKRARTDPSTCIALPPGDADEPAAARRASQRPLPRGWLFAALALAGVAGTLHATRGAAAPAAACGDASYRQLDFWLGDWDVFDLGGEAAVARAHIARILDGCVVHELYESADVGGTRGESFSIFDRSRGVWHQTWVTARGALLQIEGTARAGRVELAGSYLDAQRQRVQIRAAWWPATEGVREQAETSRDGGHSWKPEFDLVFRPHRG